MTIVHKRPKKLGREGDGYAQHACSLSETGNLADFQGENDPVYLPQIHMQERGMEFKIQFSAFSRTMFIVILLLLTLQALFSFAF